MELIYIFFFMFCYPVAQVLPFFKPALWFRLSFKQKLIDLLMIEDI